MSRILVLLAVIAGAPGCAYRWSATPDGKLLAGCAEKTIVVADSGLDVLETYVAAGKPGVVEISPDGNWIVFNTEDASQVWLVDRKAKTQRKLGEEKGFVFYVYNAWSPTSKRLAFVRTRQNQGDPGPKGGELRVVDLATSEERTAVESCTGSYAWTPSGDGLFLVQYYSEESKPGTVKIRQTKPDSQVLYWTDGALPRPLALATGPTIVEALSDDEALFTSSVVSFPAPADPERAMELGLFRTSRSKPAVARVGASPILWLSLSPDRKRLVALVLKGSVHADEVDLGIELLDTDGKSLCALDRTWGGHAVLPTWLGNERLLVNTGKDDASKWEVFRADGTLEKAVTEKVKAWAK